MHLILAQTVPIDFNPMVLAVVPIVGVLVWYITRVVQRQDKIYEGTVAQNAELVAALKKADSDNATLWADNKELSKDVDFLKRQVVVLENRSSTLAQELASLRSASDAERTQFNQRSIEYQEKIKADAKTIEILQAAIDKLNIKIADLEAQIKVLTGLLNQAGAEKAQLRKDTVMATGTAAEVAIEAVKTAIDEATPAVNITPGTDVGITDLGKTA